MEGGEDTNRIYDDLAGISSGGKRRLTRRKGLAFRVSNKDRPHDPGGGVERIRGAIPQEDQIMNLNMDTDRACCDNPVPTISIKRAWSTGQEEGQTKIMLTEPSRCPVNTKEVEGTIMDTGTNIPDRCCHCGIQMTTGHNSVMTKDKYMEPRPGRTDPVEAESAQMEGKAVLLHPGRVGPDEELLVARGLHLRLFGVWRTFYAIVVFGYCV